MQYLIFQLKNLKTHLMKNSKTYKLITQKLKW